MNWYDNPTIAAILGALAGAALSTIASVYLWRRTQKIKKIQCVINDVSSLLSISEKIRDQMHVTYSGNPVESIYLASITITNIGNTAIENQPINVRLSDGSEIADYTIKTDPPVGFGDITEENRQLNCLDLGVSLINPRDQIVIEIVSIDNKDDTIDIYLKNANVETQTIRSKTGTFGLEEFLSDNNMMLLAVASSVPFFGGFARSLINVGLAQRVSRITRN